MHLFREVRLFLSASEPHDDNHENCETQDEPRLNVLWQKTGGRRRLFLNWFVHGSLLLAGFRGSYYPRRVNVIFFLPMAR